MLQRCQVRRRVPGIASTKKSRASASNAQRLNASTGPCRTSRSYSAVIGIQVRGTELGPPRLGHAILAYRCTCCLRWCIPFPFPALYASLTGPSIKQSAAARCPTAHPEYGTNATPRTRASARCISQGTPLRRPSAVHMAVLVPTDISWAPVRLVGCFDRMRSQVLHGHASVVRHLGTNPDGHTP